jgi:hypothetical protein
VSTERIVSDTSKDRAKPFLYQTGLMFRVDESSDVCKVMRLDQSFECISARLIVLSSCEMCNTSKYLHLMGKYDRGKSCNCYLDRD